MNKYVKTVFVVCLLFMLNGCTISNTNSNETLCDDNKIVVDKECISPEIDCTGDITDQCNKLFVEKELLYETYTKETKVTYLKRKNSIEGNHNLDININKVVYNPVEKRLSIDIDNESFIGVYHILVYNENKELIQEHINNVVGEVTVFTELKELSKTYYVVVLQGDIDDDIFKEASLIVTLKDPEAENRDGFRLTNRIRHGFSFISPEYDLPYIKYGLIFDEESVLIRELKFVLKPKNSNYELERVIDVSSVERTNQTLDLKDLVIENLGIWIEYEFDIYASGTDGVDDFEDIYIASDTDQTVDISGIYYNYKATRYHGVVGYVKSIEVVEDFLKVEYYYKNNEKEIDPETGEIIEMKLVTYSKDDDKKYEYEIKEGSNTLLIPYDEITFYDQIKMVYQSDEEVVSYGYIPMPDIRAGVGYNPETKEIEVGVHESEFDKIKEVNIWVSFYNDENQEVVIERYNSVDFREETIYQITSEFDIEKDIVFNMEILYLYLGEYIAFTLGYWQ